MNKCLANGKTALHVAAATQTIREATDIVRILLEKGAEPTYIAADGTRVRIVDDPNVRSCHKAAIQEWQAKPSPPPPPPPVHHSPRKSPTSEGPDKKRAKKEAAAPPAPVPAEPPKRVTARKFLDLLRKNTEDHVSEWLVRSEDNVCLEWEKDILRKKMKLVEFKDYEYNKQGPGCARKPDFFFKSKYAIQESKYAKDNKNDYFKTPDEKIRAFIQVDEWMRKDAIFAYDTWIFIKSAPGDRTTFKRLPEVEEQFFDRFPRWSEENIKEKAVPRFWLVTFSPIL